MPGLHFHDLRHVGGTLAAATGASVKELMAGLGHSSTRAAMIYRARDQRPRSGHRQGPGRLGSAGLG
jgi:integrase